MLVPTDGCYVLNPVTILYTQYKFNYVNYLFLHTYIPRECER